MKEHNLCSRRIPSAEELELRCKTLRIYPEDEETARSLFEDMKTNIHLREHVYVAVLEEELNLTTEAIRHISVG